MDQVLLWGGFAALVAVVLYLDLFLFNKEAHEVSLKESMLSTLGYVALACAFGGFLIWHLGTNAGMLFFTGYVVELSLSMDNMFVIALIFGFFNIPRVYQHRVLFWGILGAVLFRGIMIGAGTTLVNQFHWILYFFGAFLVYSGYKILAGLLNGEDDEEDIGNNKVVKFIRRIIPVTPELHGEKFFVQVPTYRDQPADHGGVLAVESVKVVEKYTRFATPLFLTLACVEVADVVFAVDSIPAILAITTDPFLVFTSNIFAILGLRSLYFFLSEMIHRFHYLKFALAVVLAFIGIKILVADFFHISPAVSLAVTLGLLGTGVVYSLVKTRGQTAPAEAPATPAE